MSIFNQLAKKDRLTRNMTQLEYAKLHGMETSTAVSLWESGKRRVPDSVLEVLFQLPRYRTCPTCNGVGMLEIKQS